MTTRFLVLAPLRNAGYWVDYGTAWRKCYYTTDNGKPFVELLPSYRFF